MNCTFLANTPLFHGIKEDEISEMLPCVGAHERRFKKGELVFRAGDAVGEVGLVESGSVNIVVNFYWGASHIFGHISKGDMFAENYAAIPGCELLNDVVAAEDTTVVLLEMSKLLTTCSRACPFHQRTINNLLRILAQKNLNLSQRMLHTAPKTIRGKLLSYLSQQASEAGSPHFAIPFSRQQLADYLGVDRSALSNELSKMAADGLISYRKNEFTLNGEAEPYL